MNNINRNQYLISVDFFRYLPSRFYVITNILFILPLFSKTLSVNEMGIFQIGISLLNLICTIFFDWVSKSVLRFYNESKLKNELKTFFSNIFILFIINYLILLILYILFQEQLCKILHTNNVTIISIMILVIPCIIRQFLYQMLRLLNKTILYTVSIIVYQILLVAITLILIQNKIHNVTAIFTAMAIAITIIDILIVKYISSKVNFCITNYKNQFVLKFLKYGIPLVCTNFFIWSLLNYNKYYFRIAGDFNATGELALAAFITGSILTAIFSTLLFAIFPRIIKRYATKRPIKPILTDTIKLYFVYFLPITMLFCLFPQSILNIFSNNQYSTTVYVLPIFAIVIFIHELGKIINIKYHLLNKNYIDTIVAGFSGITCVIINGFLAQRYGIVGSAIAMLIGFLLWIIINANITSPKMSYINWHKAFKTILLCIIVCFIAYFIAIQLTQQNSSIFSQSLQLIIDLIICYLLLFQFRKIILR